MSPDPPRHSSWLAEPLALLTTWLVRVPKSILLLAALLTVLSVLYTVPTLGFRGSRLDLLNPASAFNQRWLAYLEAFGDQDDVVIVVTGPGRSDLLPVVEHLEQELLGEREFRAILAKRDLSPLRGKALHYLADSQLASLEQFVAAWAPVRDGDWQRLSARNVLAGVQQADGADRSTAAGDWVREYMRCLIDSLAGTEGRKSPWTETIAGVDELAARFGSRYVLADEGRLGLIVLRLGDPRRRPPSLDAHVKRLRELVAEARKRFPAVQIGVTGMPVLEVDEMQASQRDSLFASLLSLVGVAGVFLVGFGGLRRPLFSVLVLLVSLAWSLAYTAFFVGHLNILSAAFGVILIGLGVDFSIHYLSQYSAYRRGADNAAALVQTARSVGPGIVTGGVTTALAFSTAGLTHFTGVAELGVIVAGGILLCVLATIVVLPVIVVCWDRPLAAAGILPLDIARYLRVSDFEIGWRYLAGIAAASVVAAGIVHLRYDHNLLHLQPAGSESVALEHELSERLEQGVWYALSTSEDLDLLRRRKRQFEQLGSVTGTEEIVSLLPASSESRRQTIARIDEQLRDLPPFAPPIQLAPQQGLVQALEPLRPLLDDGRPSHAGQRLAAIADLPPDVYAQRLADFQERMSSDLLAVLWMIRSMADARAPSLSDLPESLTTRFVGRQGQHLLRVYGHSGIWDMGPLEQFVRQLEAIDPRITGHPVQTFYASRQMQRSFLNAALYSLLAVSIVLMLDFRKVRRSLLATIPMVLGMLLMFGVLGWLAIPLNPANLIVLPLILGIGIDDGVHVVHDCFRQAGSSYRLSLPTANAVILTSATTMIGFGSLTLASHRGLRSLGQVLTIGIFCCLTTSLWILPPLLRRYRGAFSEGD